MTKTASRPSGVRMLTRAFTGLLLLVSAAANAAEVHIKIDNFVFNPPSVTIKPGDTVVWENADDIPHSIVSKTAGVFRSRALDTDDKFSFTFAGTGSFDYFCGLHPHMQGKIIVEP